MDTLNFIVQVNGAAAAGGPPAPGTEFSSGPEVRYESFCLHPHWQGPAFERFAKQLGVGVGTVTRTLMERSKRSEPGFETDSANPSMGHQTVTGRIGIFCLSGCLSRPQLVVWGRAQAAVPQEPSRVPNAVRDRGSLSAVLG